MLKTVMAALLAASVLPSAQAAYACEEPYFWVKHLENGYSTSPGAPVPKGAEDAQTLFGELKSKDFCTRFLAAATIVPCCANSDIHEFNAFPGGANVVTDAENIMIEALQKDRPEAHMIAQHYGEGEGDSRLFDAAQKWVNRHGYHWCATMFPGVGCR